MRQSHEALRQPYIRQAPGTLCRGFGVLAPEFLLKNLVHYGKRMCLLSAQPAVGERQAKHQAAKRGHGEPKRRQPGRIMPGDHGL